MYAEITIRMDREIEPGKHYIMPGGYEVTASGKQYQFDFNDCYGHVDVHDKTLVHFIVRDEDDATFPGINELRKHFHQITGFTECFVYTGEYDEPEINPVELVDFSITDRGIEPVHETTPTSTAFVVVENCSGPGRYWEYRYEFQRPLLQSVFSNREAAK